MVRVVSVSGAAHKTKFGQDLTSSSVLIKAVILPKSIPNNRFLLRSLEEGAVQGIRSGERWGKRAGGVKGGQRALERKQFECSREERCSKKKINPRRGVCYDGRLEPWGSCQWVGFLVGPPLRRSTEGSLIRVPRVLNSPAGVAPLVTDSSAASAMLCSHACPQRSCALPGCV